jgi:hypothetical protein
MTVTDIIQIATLAILAITLILFVMQIKLQNKVLNAQLLRDRFEMYWQTYEPVTQEEVQELHLYPDDYMDIIKYETVYKNDPIKIKRYIGLLSLYEYLAFSYTMKRLRLPDPLGYQWTESWASDLLEYPEFKEVHEYHKEYYPEFAKYVDEVIGKKELDSA